MTGGETAAAAALLAAAQRRPGAWPRPRQLQEAKGEPRPRWRCYDRLAIVQGPLASSRSAMRAVELRLASGRIDGTGGGRLDRLLYAWRGDQRELALRERLAELRAHAGAWRAALGLLRETETISRPTSRRIHAELVDMFAACCAGTRTDRCRRSSWSRWSTRMPTCCRTAQPARRWRHGWRTACWRWTCRTAPGRCWRN